MTRPAGGTVHVRYLVGDVQASDDITAEVARLRAAGIEFRSDVVSGAGGRQIVLDDPAGNPVELFQPASPT